MDRLSSTDLINLAVESADTPMNIGAIAVLDGTRWRLGLPGLRALVGRRLAYAPPLRRVIHHPGLLAGGPLWIDDPRFSIERHVHEVAIPAPGDQETLLRLATELLSPVMDRAHPLWRLWLVTGLSSGDVAVIFAMHHVLADGLAAMQLASTLLAEDMPGSPAPWAARPAPSWREAFRANLRTHRAISLRWPPREHWKVLARAARAPRSSLNAKVGSRRRLAALRISLADAKLAAHRHGAKVNDVILNLAAGGLRALLDTRGDDVKDVHASVAVSLRTQEQGSESGNRTGGILVTLPTGDPDPVHRLCAIAANSASAKQDQLVTTANTLLMWLARMGLLRHFSQHQRLAHVIESNLIGPPEEISLLGAPVRELIPVGTLAGNLAISFLALSYNGQLTVTVQADAAHFPDLPVLTNAMKQDWTALLDESRQTHEPATV